MRVLDLFSGIGGFSLGLERAGMRTAAFCEVDPFCRAVLAQHWPGVLIYDDVKALDRARLAADGIAVDLIAGGFPCQPWSVAGHMRGHDDDRDLWPEMLRVIRDVRPRWVVGENVPGLDDKRFMALDRVLADLEGEAYEAQAFEIPACAVDAPHKRSRLFIVANRPGEGLPLRGGVAGDAGPQQSTAQRDCALGNGAGERSEGQPLSVLAREADPYAHWSGAEWLVAPDGTARRVKPGIRLLADGFPGRTHQIRALGNAVVPQVVEVIGRAILSAEAGAT